MYLFYVLFFCFVSGGVIKNDLFPLNIVHYNDFHARFEETSVNYPVCKVNDTSCLGGFPRLYQEIKTLLKQYPDALLLNAGDVYQGTYWYTFFKWNVTVEFINMLPNDAHAIGNHEFDDSIVGLVPYLQRLKGPVLAANLDTSLEPSLSGLYKPHVVVERHGRKIGIIGLITTSTKTSSNPGEVIFLDPIPIVQREAQLLTDQGVDIIIVLSHCGLDVDIQIAKTVGENIDVIVGGHTHSLLWNGTSPSNETISGPYPITVEHENGHKVLIVTASAFTKYLGNITVYFDASGNVQMFDATPIFLNRSIPEDPEIKNLLQPYSQYIHNMIEEVIGKSNDYLPDEGCASQECAIGNLVADAFLEESRLKKPSNLTTVALLVRNNVRASLPKGDIIRGAVINILPFTNNVVSFEIRGKYILEALKHCIEPYWNIHPYAGPLLPQVSGLRVALNTTEPRQVVSVEVKEGDQYKPLQMEQMYQVVTLDFLRRGRSGFKMFKDHGKNSMSHRKDAVVVENYIKAITPITPSDLIQNRLIIMN
ncbi:apyrase [Manduca sexta]|uniref:apyrase n=1 Tax=Manduca sexta TaxID=7130 RepID=UPI00188F51CB|nr:apyrase [Manduca sexta]